VSIIYHKHKQFITSTHTNYFDQVFKERGAKPLVELDYYTDPNQLVNIPLTFFFLSILAEVNHLTPNKPTIITY
jgi:hypothetical protein